MECAAPGCKIITYHGNHCPKHAKVAVPHYLKYKKIQSTYLSDLSNMCFNTNMIKDYCEKNDIDACISFHTKLEILQNLRKQFQSIFFKTEKQDDGHNNFIEQIGAAAKIVASVIDSKREKKANKKKL